MGAAWRSVRFHHAKLRRSSDSRYFAYAGFSRATPRVVRNLPFEGANQLKGKSLDLKRKCSGTAGDTPKVFASRQPPLQLNQAAACGTGDGFGAADDVHLGEDGFHVGLHCAFADKQRRANFLIAFSVGHKLEHVDLART